MPVQSWNTNSSLGPLPDGGWIPISAKVYEGVRVTFKIKADATQEELEEICKLGPTYSPVFDIFTNKVPVSVQLAKREETAEVLAA